MPLLRDWTLTLTPEQVLLAQGLDPQAASPRTGRMLAIAAQALQVGLPLLDPLVTYQEERVKSLVHERLQLSGGGVITGKSAVQRLASARKVVAALCTIGPAIEKRASSLMDDDLLLALALDGVGTAAAESLGIAACRLLGEMAASSGLEASLPLSPGIDGWPVEHGHPLIFSLVDAPQAGIRLTPDNMMLPRKTVSLLIGLAPEIDEGGRICDFCSQRSTCRRQDTYA